MQDAVASDVIKATASPLVVVATCLLGNVHGYIYGHDSRQMASAVLLWLQQQHLTVETDIKASNITDLGETECFSHSQDSNATFSRAALHGVRTASATGCG